MENRMALILNLCKQDRSTQLHKEIKRNRREELNSRVIWKGVHGLVSSLYFSVIKTHNKSQVKLSKKKQFENDSYKNISNSPCKIWTTVKNNIIDMNMLNHGW